MRSSIPQDDDPPIDRPHRTGRSAKEHPYVVATSAFFSFTSYLIYLYHNLHSELVSFQSIRLTRPSTYHPPSTYHHRPTYLPGQPVN